jgi:hypothetical protein
VFLGAVLLESFLLFSNFEDSSSSSGGSNKLFNLLLLSSILIGSEILLVFLVTSISGSGSFSLNFSSFSSYLL